MVGLIGGDGGIVVGAGQLFSGHGSAVGRLGGGDDICRDAAGGEEGLAAREVDLGLGEVGLGRLLVRRTGGDLGLQAGIFGEQGFHIAPGVGQIGLRLRLGDARIGIIELDQHLAAFHRLRVLHQHLRDGPGIKRRDGRGVGADIGIVGFGIMRRNQGVVPKAGNTNGHDAGREAAQKSLPPLQTPRIARGCCCRGNGRSVYACIHMKPLLEPEAVTQLISARAKWLFIKPYSTVICAWMLPVNGKQYSLVRKRT